MTFNAWISSEYHRIRERLALHGMLNEDALHDAYITVYTDPNMLLKASTPSQYARLIVKAYHSHIRRRVTLERIMLHADSILPMLADTTDEERIDLVAIRETQAEKADFVNQQLSKLFSTEHQALFRAHYIDGMTISDIADIYGTHRHTITRQLEAMCATIRLVC